MVAEQSQKVGNLRAEALRNDFPFMNRSVAYVR